MNLNFYCGHSSVVERLVANEKVEGSTPFARSKKIFMSDLANKKCVPCEGNIPPFNAEEIHKYLKKVDGWEVLEDKIDGFHLIKSFKFDNFLKSQEFVNKVGEIAEQKVITLIYGLDGVMQELKYSHMQLKV